MLPTLVNRVIKIEIRKVGSEMIGGNGVQVPDISGEVEEVVYLALRDFGGSLCSA